VFFSTSRAVKLKRTQELVARIETRRRPHHNR
jgi:hypothetical protein